MTHGPSAPPPGDGQKLRTKGDEAGWAVRNGRSQAKRIRELCSPLAEELKHVKVSDEFRAELLLGYIAGLPPLPKKATELEQNSDSDASKNEEGQQ